MMFACAFTGHRPTRFVFKDDETHSLCVKIKEAILSECRRLYEVDNVRTFYSGCALGVDLWGAEKVIQLQKEYKDVRLICVAPFPHHAKNWPNTQRQRLDRILETANNVITTSDRFTDKSYKVRNYYMMDNSHFLIAVFDDAKNMRSGTKQTVNYARKKGLHISLIHPDTTTIVYE